MLNGGGEESKYIPRATEIPEPPKVGGIFGAVWDQVLGFFVAMFQSVWAGFLDLVPRAFVSAFNTAGEYINAGEDAAWEGVFRLLQEISALDRPTIEQLIKFRGLPFPTNTIVNITVLTSILKEYLSTVAHATGSPARWDLNKMMSPELPMPVEILRAAFISPDKAGAVREVFRKNGLSEENIDLMFIAAYQVYDIETIRTLYLRGKISEGLMHERMRELGFTDTRIKEIVQTWEIIPGPQDLFWMVGKEAFEPDAITKMGLGDEFPAEQVQWLTMQGISEEWAKKYWYAHWDQPSIEMGYEMLHRGVINLDDLDMLFRTIEIPPFWRKKLIDINYVPFTRVDVRRMHKEGVLTDTELVQAYKDIGYDDKKATKLKEFTLKYNAKVGKDLNLTQVTAGYNDKLLTRDEALVYLTDMEYSADEAAYLLDLEDYKAQKKYQDAQIENVQKRYEGAFIDEAEARKMLNALNLPSVRTDTLINTWALSRFEELKLPSKTDLDKFYKAGIIDEDAWVTEMFRLGYASSYIGWYLALLQQK